MVQKQNSQSADECFIQSRIELRREDARVIESGEMTPEEVQKKNSLIPEDFWSEGKIDWRQLAPGE